MNGPRSVSSGAVGDARLACGVATASTVAYALFLLIQPPAGLDVLWALGVPAAVFLAPVAAGLAAYVSLVALALHAGALTIAARRWHVVSLAAALVLFVGLALMWGSGSLGSLGD